MRVAIIGAGPAGLTAAYELAKAKVSVDVYEAGNAVGGMARSFDLWDQRVDVGPHRFFSQDKRVNRLWLEVMKNDYRMVDRLTRIYYKDTFFQYPLAPFDAFFKLGPFETVRCISSYVKQKFFPATYADDSFESWVVGRFGKRLFEIFFKSYSEKLWGIKCYELDSEFAAQRIRKLSLLEAIKAAIAKPSGGKHRTLVDRFPYPLNGAGEPYLRMQQFIIENGGRVHLMSPVKSVISDRGIVTGIELMDGKKIQYDHVISTMPLTHLVKALPNVPAPVSVAVKNLKFRNTLLVYLNVKGTKLFPDNWLYVHNPKLKTGRVTNFRNWVPELCRGSENTILSMEYWCNDDEPLWKQGDDQINEMAKEEIRKMGLIGNSEILGTHIVRVPKCYPVYTLGYKADLDKVVTFLRDFKNISLIGRYGSFKYNNQDHSILMGLLAAENILAGRQLHDLWAVNADSEYQESAVISETGLDENFNKAA